MLKATGKNIVTNVKGTFKAIKELPSKLTGNSKKVVQTICDRGACFVAGTLVLTETGLRPIEEIQVGDYVWAENPTTHEKGLKRVAQTFIHEKDLLVYVYVNDEVIETTEEHPFWVEGQGWIGASNLQQGDTLRLQGDTQAVIEKVEFVEPDEEVTVYNFEVEEWHTYYVSQENILVHNICKAGEVRIRANVEASKTAREASNFSEYVKAEKKIIESTKPAPYAHLVDGKRVGAGKDFTAAQKRKIIQENMKKNGGIVKSDSINDYYEILKQPQKSMKGITPSPDEWQIDHIIPKDKGGSNSFSNAQVISRKLNRQKSNN